MDVHLVDSRSYSRTCEQYPPSKCTCVIRLVVLSTSG